MKLKLNGEQKELEAWRNAIEKRMLSFDRCMELAVVRLLLGNHNATHPKGALLHSIVKELNVDDDSINWAINYILSGDWTKHDGNICTGLQAKQQLDLLNKLKELNEYEREMVISGTTVNSDVYNFLMNGDPSGIV